MINYFYINNTNVSRKIRTEAILNVDCWALARREKTDKNSSNKKKAIHNLYRLEAKDTDIIREGVTYIDMMIADAVYYLYKTEQFTFSEGMIFLGVL